MIKDSGERTEYETGFVRDMHEGKGRFDLLPWNAIWEGAKHCEEGALKYGERNIDKGAPQHSLIDSAIRHLAKYLMGWDDEPHLRAAWWNISWALEQEVVRPEMQDIPSRMKKEEPVQVEWGPEQPMCRCAVSPVEEDPTGKQNMRKDIFDKNVTQHYNGLRENAAKKAADTIKDGVYHPAGPPVTGAEAMAEMLVEIMELMDCEECALKEIGYECKGDKSSKIASCYNKWWWFVKQQGWFEEGEVKPEKEKQRKEKIIPAHKLTALISKIKHE